MELGEKKVYVEVKLVKDKRKGEIVWNFFHVPLKRSSTCPREVVTINDSSKVLFGTETARSFITDVFSHWLSATLPAACSLNKTEAEPEELKSWQVREDVDLFLRVSLSPDDSYHTCLNSKVASPTSQVGMIRQSHTN